MKKTLLAAALLAGFAGVAHAETQVTLYGIIDTGIQYSQFTGHNASGASVKTSSFGETWGAQSGSRWGMKGTEELGDGLKAIFQLESGFDSSNGYSGQGGRLFGRQAWVGLANAAWGQVEFGRIYSVPTALLAGLDPFAQGWGLANIGTTFTALNTERLDNGIQYQSPVFAGFQFGANYSFNTDDSASAVVPAASGTGIAKNEAGLMPGNASNSNREVALALNYTNGPLFVGASYSQLNVAHSATTGLGATIREEIIGATYNFGVVKAYAAYSHGTNGFFVGSAAGLGSDGSSLTNLSAGGLSYNGTKSNSYLLGLSAPIGGATSLFASWQHSTLGGAGKLAATSDYVKYGAEASNIFSAGATYSLSKRTNLYAVASYDKGYANVNGQKAVDGIVGIRHQF